MSKKVKALIGAILALLVAGFGWYVAQTDGDPTTVPDTDAVVQAGEDVVGAVVDLKTKDTAAAEDITITETVKTEGATEAK